MPDGTAPSSFLDRLKDYKEFIAILVFFVGGALWMWGYFATKSQLSGLHCLMNANVTLIQGRMDAASISQMMIENIKTSSQLDDKAKAGPLTSDEIEQRTKLKLAADELSRKVAAANDSTTQALDNLRMGSCGT